MTEVSVIRNGKVVFHSVGPRLMTSPQVHSELQKWAVNTYNAQVLVQYNHK